MKSSPRVAIIGGGIAGLGAAYALRGVAELDLWNKGPLGGHLLPYPIKDRHGVDHWVDAGVMMFNRTEYPTVYRLFDALDVPLARCPLGFAVWDPGRGLQFLQHEMSKAYGTVLAEQTKADLADVAQLVLRGRREGFGAMENIVFADWLAKKGYHRDTIDYALIPGIAAFWGVQRREVLAASSAAAMREIARIRMVTRAAPSSKAYLDKLVAAIGPYGDRGPADQVTWGEGGVTVRGPFGEARYDRVVVATTAEVAHQLVPGAPEQTRRMLGAFRYGDTTAVMHRSRGVMAPGVESPFGYTRHGEVTITTWRLDLIHGIDTDGPFSATTGSPDLPTSGLIPAHEIEYVYRHRHLLYNVEGEAVARDIQGIDEGLPVRFAGSYFGPGGTHEPALVSGLRAAQKIRGELGAPAFEWPAISGARATEGAE